MKAQDFSYMRRGKQVQPLLPDEVAFIAPLDRRGKKKENALLMLHGFSSTPAVYRDMLEHLDKKYDALVCPALPGHVESIECFAKATAADWLQSVEAISANLLHEYETLDVMGLSLGGLLAYEVSKKLPIHHLYLLAPAFALKTNPHAAKQLARCLYWLGFRQLRNRAGNLYTDNTFEIAYRQLPLTSIIEILNLISRFEWTPPNCPTDLFLGRFDEVVDSYQVEKYFKHSDNTTIHWLENSAHLLPIDGDVETIIACLNQS